MRERGFYYEIADGLDFKWRFEPTETTEGNSENKNHNLAEAACKAFMEVDL